LRRPARPPRDLRAGKGAARAMFHVEPETPVLIIFWVRFHVKQRLKS
jgi:hypothetical protein